MKFSIQSVYSWYRSTLRNPKYRWWIIFGTLAYLVNPIDISPDFLPFIGEIDDIALVTLLVAELSQMMIDTLKQRQPNASAPQSSGDAANTVTHTVEVDAVSMNE